MTKTEIVENLYNKSGFKKKDIFYIIDNFLDSIIECTGNGEKVVIRSFGTFYRVKRKERSVYSPIAGKKIEIPSREVLAFKASKISAKDMKIEGA